MKITINVESEGNYRIVPSDLFDHAISTLEDYGDKNQNPLVSFMIDHLSKCQEIIADEEIAK